MNGDAPSRQHDVGRLVTLVLLAVLVFIFAGVIIVLYVTHSTSRVIGDSMVPTLAHDDVVLVTRGYERLNRGDIVILRPPSTVGHPVVNDMVKRVIGLPGDTVEVVEGRAFVNSSAERGSYTVRIAACDLSFPSTTLPDGQVFLLGDNRPVSEDSRLFGSVDETYIRGKVLWILSPARRFGTVD